MKKQELIEWFNNYFNNCYYVIHNDYPDSLFMYYDLKYIRKLKLCKISGKKITSPKNIVGECLFQQDWKYKILWCDYKKIWSYIGKNYSNDYTEIKNFVEDRLEEHILTPMYYTEPLSLTLKELEVDTKINVLTPKMPPSLSILVLEEHSKMNILTPSIHTFSGSDQLEEHTKMNILTPRGGLGSLIKLEEHTKMNILTPSLPLTKFQQLLEEHTKMNILTPDYILEDESKMLEEHTKMNVLTPADYQSVYGMDGYMTKMNVNE